MLLRTEGNLINMAEIGQFNVIVHGCNCHCVMGSGIAREIKDRYSLAADIDRKTIAGDYNKLGNYSLVDVGKFTIVNAYTQYNTAKYKGEDVFEYYAFRLILQKLLHQFPTANFGFPYIGMGLAGGSKEIIIDMLEWFGSEINKNGGTATLVEFSN